MIFVTGHNGFIGSSFLKLLPDELIWTYEKDLLRLERLAEPIQVILHLAASIGESGGDIVKQNVELAQKVIELATPIGAAVIFASSSAVYGTKNTKRIDESTKHNPGNNYGLSKIGCEKIVLNSGLDHCILRLFNVYGPGQATNFVIPDMINSMKKGRTPIVRSPFAFRDFIHVNDVCKLIEIIINYYFDNHRLPNSTFNVGSGNKTQIVDILRTLATYYNIDVDVQNLMNNPNAVNCSYTDISRVCKAFNWKPKVNLKDGLTELISDNG